MQPFQHQPQVLDVGPRIKHLMVGTWNIPDPNADKMKDRV